MTRADQIFESFVKFHKANPDVWKKFVEFTNVVILAGWKHYSSDAVCHRIRWHHATERQTDFKINNNFTVYYSSLFEVAHPEHAGFFRKRHRPSKHRNERGEGFESQNTDEQIDDQMREQLLKLL